MSKKNASKKSTKKLRVWWIRNVPGTPEYYPVKDVKEAIVLIKKLAKKDLKDKSVTDNASGLEIFENGEWSEFYDDDGRSIDDILEDLEEKEG